MLLVVTEGWNEHHFIECTTIILRWSPAVSVYGTHRQAAQTKRQKSVLSTCPEDSTGFYLHSSIFNETLFLHQTFFFRRILNIFNKDLFHENQTLYKICTWEAWKGGEKWDLRLMKVSEYREVVYKFFAVM